MRRLYHRSIIDELNDIREYMDSLFHQMEDIRTPLLPVPRENSRLMPQLRSDFRIDVTDNGDHVVVTADMIPGIVKEDISIDLINPQTLEISCERKEETEEEKTGYYLRERSFGVMSRIVPIPKPVTEEGGKASLKDGILTVTLKKIIREPANKILIEG